MGAQFFETPDSIEESVSAIVELTWPEIKAGESRLRKVQLERALTLWVTKGYVVVPDDYEDR